MIEPERYTITVRNVQVEGESYFRATVAELPDLEQFGSTAAEVYELAIAAIQGLQTAAVEEGAAFPAPNDDIQEFSGRVTLRMPPSIHEKASRFADAEATSLNQYLVAILAATIGAAKNPSGVWDAASTWVMTKNLKPATFKTISTKSTGFDTAQLYASMRTFLNSRLVVASQKAEMTLPANVVQMRPGKRKASGRKLAVR